MDSQKSVSHTNSSSSTKLESGLIPTDNKVLVLHTYHPSFTTHPYSTHPPSLPLPTCSGSPHPSLILSLVLRSSSSFNTTFNFSLSSSVRKLRSSNPVASSTPLHPPVAKSVASTSRSAIDDIILQLVNVRLKI